MKRKTWMISADVCLVFMGMLRGYVHVLKNFNGPSGPASVERRESQVPESIREEETGEE